MKLAQLTAKRISAFWSKVEVAPSGCWLWTGAKDCHGYGWMRVGDRSEAVHRIAWMMQTSTWPEHRTGHRQSCPRHCVRFAHLKPGHAHAIRDQFSDLPISRERKRQLRKAARGLCSKSACQQPMILYPFCLEHAIERRERQRQRQGNVRRINSLTYQLA